MFRIEFDPEIMATEKELQRKMDPVWSKGIGIHVEMFNGDPVEVKNAMSAFYDTLETSERECEIVSVNTNPVPYGIVAYVTYWLG